MKEFEAVGVHRPEGQSPFQVFYLDEANKWKCPQGQIWVNNPDGADWGIEAIPGWFYYTLAEDDSSAHEPIGPFDTAQMAYDDATLQHNG